MKNWKTTACGIAGAIAVWLQNSPDPKLHLLGQILAAGALLLGGVAAKDYNVSHSQK